MCRILFCGVIFAVLAGCSSVPPKAPNTVSYAYEVGDRMGVSLGEVVGAVFVPDSTDNRIGKHLNLHVGMTAIVNPLDSKDSNKIFSSSVNEAESIVVQNFPRIKAMLLEEILKSGKVYSLDNLKFDLTRKANSAFQELYSKWAYAKNYRIELIVTSMYYTDPSVAITANRQNRFWLD